MIVYIYARSEICFCHPGVRFYPPQALVCRWPDAIRLTHLAIVHAFVFMEWNPNRIWYNIPVKRDQLSSISLLIIAKYKGEQVQKFISSTRITQTLRVSRSHCDILRRFELNPESHIIREIADHAAHRRPCNILVVEERKLLDPFKVHLKQIQLIERKLACHLVKQRHV